MTRLWTAKLRNRLNSIWGKSFITINASRVAMGSTQPSIQCVLWAPFPWVKQLGHKADAAPSSAAVKNKWSYTTPPPLTFMVCTLTTLLLHIKLQCCKSVPNQKAKYPTKSAQFKYFHACGLPEIGTECHIEINNYLMLRAYIKQCSSLPTVNKNLY
jgi:hypothetical protein